MRRGLLVFLLIAAGCRRSEVPPPVAGPAAAPLVAPAPPSVGPADAPAPDDPEPARAPATEDCPQEHAHHPWRPRETTSQPVRTTPCATYGDCAPLVPSATRWPGCADFGPRCRPTLLTPTLTATDTEAARRTQAILDAATADERAEPGDCGMVMLDYTIHHNADGVLNLTFRVSHDGAYPSTYIPSSVTIDLRKGEKIGADAFRRDKVGALIRLVQVQVRAAVARAGVTFEEDTPEGAFRAEELDRLLVTREGLVFVHDFAIPHAGESLTPRSEYLVPWDRVRPFLDPAGALARVR
jgi:hypothetical protein